MLSEYLKIPLLSLSFSILIIIGYNAFKYKKFAICYALYLIILIIINNNTFL